VSELESFLARWTRLKREAERREAEKTTPADAARVPSQPAEGTHPDVAPSVDGEEPTVDLSALPPLDQITATTDIRAYLAPGVPAELARAALRRAWVADPTIRDFIGIAENQWDFNDPNGIPGFGPLEDAGRLVAQLLGGHQEPAAPPPADVPVPEIPRDTASPLDSPATIDESAPVADEPLDPASPFETNMPAQAPIAAPQQASTGLPRGHGGALPK